MLNVFYMKYSAIQGGISSFVVGRTGSKYGLPVAVYIQCSLQGNLSRAAPPMGNRNRTIELSTVPVRAHCPSGGGGGGGRYNTIWLRVYDPIFVVPARTCGLYETPSKTMLNQKKNQPMAVIENRHQGPG